MSGPAIEMEALAHAINGGLVGTGLRVDPDGRGSFLLVAARVAPGELAGLLEYALATLGREPRSRPWRRAECGHGDGRCGGEPAPEAAR